MTTSPLLEFVNRADALLGGAATDLARVRGLDALVPDLRALTPDDLLLEAAWSRAPAIGWVGIDLFARGRWHLSLFLLRAGEEIPLHDHPGMWGLLRVISGRLLAEPWDWEQVESRLARREPDVELDPAAEPLRVAPLRGNVHRLVAREDAAFLDLFAPHYDPGGGRRCRYWDPFQPPGPDGLARLREVLR